MGFEYQFRISPPNRLDIVDLVEALSQTNHYRVVTHSPEQVGFGYADVPTRPNWPDDWLIIKNKSSVALVIHAGSLQQRNRVLEDLKNYILKRGMTCDVEEL